MMEHGLIGQNVMVSVSKRESGRVKILALFCSIGPQALTQSLFNQKYNLCIPFNPDLRCDLFFPFFLFWKQTQHNRERRCVGQDWKGYSMSTLGTGTWASKIQEMPTSVTKIIRYHFLRNQNESNEETEERDCKRLCFFDVTNDIDTELGMCSIQQRRTRRRTSEFQTEQPLKRLMGGKTVFSGSLSYVVRLTFQSFDQYHSDSQDLFRNSYIRQEFADQNRLVPDRTRKKSRTGEKNLGPFRTGRSPTVRGFLMFY